MNINSEFLPLLSRVMDEALDAEDSEILQNVNEIRLITDEQLVPAIEKIQYINKYKIIENIKNICKNISLYMYFPDLIGKNVIGFYHPNGIIRRSIYSNYLKKTFDTDSELSAYINECANVIGKKGNRNIFFEDVPVFICGNSSSSLISFLNVANKSVDVSYKEYISLLRHVKEKKVCLGRLVDASFIPVQSDLSNKAIAIIPSEVKKKNKYYNTICDSVDVLVMSGKEATKDVISEFNNVSTLFIIGKVSVLEKGRIKQYCSDKGIDLIFDEKLLFEVLADDNYDISRNNFCFKYFVENQLYEISWYLAERKEYFEKSINKINADLIYKDGDNKAGELVKKIQIKYNDTINELSQLYNEYKAIVDVLVEKIDFLQKKFYIQEGVNCLNNHISMNETLIELLIKVSGTFKAFPENNAKEVVRSYKVLCDINNNTMADIIFDDFIGEKPSFNKVESALNNRYKSNFIKHEQVKTGFENNVDCQVLSHIISDITTQLNAVEYFILGQVLINQGKNEEAIAYLDKAVVGGIEEAGSLIVSKTNPDDDYLTELAEYGVASAAFVIGKKICTNSGNENDETGLKYLHIAAAKNINEAIKLLGDISFENSNKLKDKNGEKALHYYLIAEKKGLSGSGLNERIAKLYFAKQDYRQAEKYFKKANTADAYYYLGIICKNGLGCAKNEEQALKYYEKAMSKGHMDAQVSYERLMDKIVKEKAKNTVEENTSYSSYTYYSGYYSSGW